MAKPEIEVVCGLIVNPAQEILIAKRPAHTSFAGWWEFPGGKVEANEDSLSALIRELKEEVLIEVTDAKPFHFIRYEDEEKVLKLDFWQVLEFSGAPHGNEGQEIRWVGLDQLHHLQILEANREVVLRLAGNKK